MSDQVAIALIGTIVPTLTVIVAAWLQTRSTRKGQAKTDQAVGEVHTIANGRTEKLLQELAEKNEKIAELSRLLPPPPGTSHE